MAIDGSSIRPAEFWDEETSQLVQINLQVRDIVYFRLLQRIERALLNKI